MEQAFLIIRIIYDILIELGVPRFIEDLVLLQLELFFHDGMEGLCL